MTMTGAEIVALMRLNRITIRDLAQRMQITQKRIRQVRRTGLKGAELIRDWLQGITGEDPGAAWWLTFDRPAVDRQHTLAGMEG